MGEVALRKTQAALEVTRGTKIAATRKVYGQGSFAEKVGIIRPQNEERGVFIANYRSQAGLIDSQFPFNGTATYEDLPWWMQMGLKGGVTGVLSSTSVYTYTFVPTASTDDLKSMTVEWGDDTQAWQAGFGMVDTFEITGALGQAWTFTANVLVDDFATATFTGALSDRVTEDVLTQLTKLAIGNAGAVPSSYITGRFIGFKFKINNQLVRKYFADGAAAKFSGMGRKTRLYSLEMDFEGNAATITERALYDSQTPRVVRLTASGTNIPSSSPTTAKSVDIVLPGIWTDYQVQNRDTNTTFHAVLEGQYDAALGYDLSLAVANALVTLP